MNYQVSDFGSVQEIEAKIHALGSRRQYLWRQLQELNRSGRRYGYASLEDAYKNDPMVREIHDLGYELSILWNLVRMKCAGGAAFGVRTRVKGEQGGHRKG